MVEWNERKYILKQFFYVIWNDMYFKAIRNFFSEIKSFPNLVFIFIFLVLLYILKYSSITSGIIMILFFIFALFLFHYNLYKKIHFRRRYKELKGYDIKHKIMEFKKKQKEETEKNKSIITEEEKEEKK